MYRLKFVLIGLGCALAFIGFQEFRVSQGTTDEPIAVNLMEVEAGQKPDNSHWNLGEHVAIYNAGVYQYSKSKYSPDAVPGADTKIDFYYYPVLSKGHPFIKRLGALNEKYGSLEAVPETEVPALNEFAVLVKTKKFTTIGEIPGEWEVEPSIQGLVVNQITSLKKDEDKLLKESFPGLNTDKLLLLEAGRTPASIFKSFGMMGAGSAMVLAGGAWLFAGRKSA